MSGYVTYHTPKGRKCIEKPPQKRKRCHEDDLPLGKERMERPSSLNDDFYDHLVPPSKRARYGDSIYTCVSKGYLHNKRQRSVNNGFSIMWLLNEFFKCSKYMDSSKKDSSCSSITVTESWVYREFSSYISFTDLLTLRRVSRDLHNMITPKVMILPVPILEVLSDRGLDKMKHHKDPTSIQNGMNIPRLCKYKNISIPANILMIPFSAQRFEVDDRIKDMQRREESKQSLFNSWYNVIKASGATVEGVFIDDSIFETPYNVPKTRSAIKNKIVLEMLKTITTVRFMVFLHGRNGRHSGWSILHSIIKLFPRLSSFYIMVEEGRSYSGDGTLGRFAGDQMIIERMMQELVFSKSRLEVSVPVKNVYVAFRHMKHHTDCLTEIVMSTIMGFCSGVGTPDSTTIHVKTSHKQEHLMQINRPYGKMEDQCHNETCYCTPVISGRPTELLHQIIDTHWCLVKRTVNRLKSQGQEFQHADGCVSKKQHYKPWFSYIPEDECLSKIILRIITRVITDGKRRNMNLDMDIFTFMSGVNPFYCSFFFVLGDLIEHSNFLPIISIIDNTSVQIRFMYMLQGKTPQESSSMLSDIDGSLIGHYIYSSVLQPKVLRCADGSRNEDSVSNIKECLSFQMNTYGKNTYIYKTFDTYIFFPNQKKAYLKKSCLRTDSDLLSKSWKR